MGNANDDGVMKWTENWNMEKEKMDNVLYTKLFGNISQLEN
jgi:hypothetical protein